VTPSRLGGKPPRVTNASKLVDTKPKCSSYRNALVSSQGHSWAHFLNPTQRVWRPRFLMSIITANDRISRVKPTDIDQTEVNMGHHLENRADNPYWPPWPSQHTRVVKLWSKARSNPTETLVSLNILRNFCRVLQISPKHFKISQYESCPVFWGTQLSCWMWKDLAMPRGGE
jgi:hypothetical protein